ncbi:hypothetical protein ACOZ9A_004442 [Vibrio parahaemolyticus]
MVLRIKSPKTCHVVSNGALVMYADYAALEKRFNELSEAAAALQMASNEDEADAAMIKIQEISGIKVANSMPAQKIDIESITEYAQHILFHLPANKHQADHIKHFVGQILLHCGHQEAGNDL